jgi:hypothetical protein
VLVRSCRVLDLSVWCLCACHCLASVASTTSVPQFQHRSVSIAVSASQRRRHPPQHQTSASPLPLPPHCCHCRELAVQLKRDLLPALRNKGVKMFLVGIGTPERSLQFAEMTREWPAGLPCVMACLPACQ